MTDQGVRIVKMARAILHNDFALEQPATGKTEGLSRTLKAICLTALLAAFGGSGVTLGITEARRPINHYEKVELDALVFYAARQKALDEAGFRQLVHKQFDVASFDAMTAADYRSARDFLHGQIR